ncbi:MAG: ketoacid-CoA transferase [Deltaproteobacteria bacterium]|nr:ketoacid-CoA transferase [Deltaproteobacteria bacterium]
MEYTLREMMTIMAAREIHDGDIVFCGTGIPMLAAMAAKNINAPGSIMFFETGALDSKLEEIPMSIADSRVMYKTSSNLGIMEAFCTMQNRITGDHVVAILGAAQIDKFGNLNSTSLGDYFHPSVRMPGSGGACDAASFVPRLIIFIDHERRRFKKKVDYLTSPGYLDGPDGRRKAGLPDGGPAAVVTNMGVMKFSDTTKELYLANYYPGITPQKILENMEFSVDVSQATEAVPPSEAELKILRDTCDPHRLIL